MLDEDKALMAKEDNEIDKEIDKSLSSFPISSINSLNEKENEIVKNLIEAPTKADLQTQFDLFNMNQSKKNALRLIKLTNLMDKVEDQVIERLTTRPDLVSNRELIDAMTVVSNQIEKTQKANTEILSTDNTSINITNKKTEVNINVGPDLTRDESERVLDAVQLLLKQVKGTSSVPLTPQEDSTIIDADTINNSENDENSTEEIVYDNVNLLNNEEQE